MHGHATPYSLRRDLFPLGRFLSGDPADWLPSLRPSSVPGCAFLSPDCFSTVMGVFGVRHRPTGEQWMSTALLGLVMFAGNYSCLFWSEKVLAVRPCRGYLVAHSGLGAARGMAGLPIRGGNSQGIVGHDARCCGRDSYCAPFGSERIRTDQGGGYPGARHVVLGRRNGSQLPAELAQTTHDQRQPPDGLGRELSVGAFRDRGRSFLTLAGSLTCGIGASHSAWAT